MPVLAAKPLPVCGDRFFVHLALFLVRVQPRVIALSASPFLPDQSNTSIDISCGARGAIATVGTVGTVGTAVVHRGGCFATFRAFFVPGRPKRAHPPQIVPSPTARRPRCGSNGSSSSSGSSGR